MLSQEDRNKIRVLSSPLDDLISEFHLKFDFDIAEFNDDCQYFKFERSVNDGDHHVVILEDHRWEAERPDFDPKVDIGDWVIFSMLDNAERDWFGRFVESQYPLTYSEYQMLEKIIKEVERTWSKWRSEETTE